MDAETVEKLKARGSVSFIARRASEDLQALAVNDIAVLWSVAAVTWPGAGEGGMSAYTIIRTTTREDSALELFAQMGRDGAAPAYVLLAFDPRQPCGWRELARSPDKE